MFREKSNKILILITLLWSSWAAGETPTDGAGWYQAATTARGEERFDDAFDALDKAEEQDFAPIRINFERARLYTLTGDNDAASAEVAAMAESGFTGVGYIVNDPILSTLEGEAGYDAAIAAMSKLAYPCENNEAFDQFDFWLGEWEVHGPAGGFAGTNSITKEERGCMLQERWVNAAGGTGQSINYVDQITGEWVQVWNAEGGSQINIRGGLTDDGMLLVGTLHTVGTDTTIPFRALWSLLPDGRVRQFFEQSTDDGETWTTWFEGFYTRKE
ncbi:MAG: hypothetical protein GWP62_14360 [Gammaproteobacteria bacterium]|nr:hypothetical protein [Gammaproteobacteria bacterium]